MPTYPVKQPLRHGGTRHEAGATVELEADDAKRLQRRGVVGAAIEDPPSKDSAPEADITDAAAELAAEHDLDLTDVVGSGEGGRILKSDVDALIDAS